jgi:5-formyltetrahydrofolate cyclo-ligase
LKKDLARKTYLKKRQELSSLAFKNLSTRAIYKMMILIEEYKPKCIHCFLPILTKGEINTMPIIDYCWNNAIDVVVPVTNFKDKTLKNAEFKPDTQTKITSLNITEPMNPVWKSNNIIDLVITPLLAFDMKGFRVGYGGGFYDRFFASLGMNINRVGISLFDPCEFIDDMSELDIPLTHCVTPRRIYSF